MIDLEHVHAVKAGEQTFIALIIGGGVQHLFIDHLVVIPVQHLAQQIEVRLKPVCETAQSPDKIMIQAVCYVQSESVNVKFFHPASDTVQYMIDHILMPQVELHQIVVALPSLIPQAVVIV